jgi:flagellum-specific peptidoglycan hydrolase FlgJ
MTHTDFIAAIAPDAVASSAKTQVPASFTIAQGALESAWGTNAPCYNLFGIKPGPNWDGAVQVFHTHEEINGVMVAMPLTFRAYASWQECMDDHGAFFHANPRYANAFACTDAESFARTVAADHYATDSAYGDKLVSIMRAHNLAQYDSMAGAVSDPARSIGAPAANSGETA